MAVNIVSGGIELLLRFPAKYDWQAHFENR